MFEKKKGGWWERGRDVCLWWFGCARKCVYIDVCLSVCEREHASTSISLSARQWTVPGNRSRQPVWLINCRDYQPLLEPKWPYQYRTGPIDLLSGRVLGLIPGPWLWVLLAREVGGGQRWGRDWLATSGAIHRPSGFEAQCAMCQLNSTMSTTGWLRPIRRNKPA